MFNTLYLLNYNNYYNRLIKKEDTLQAYSPYVVAELTATNFNPNDHIDTNHIVNIDDNLSPDYAIILNEFGEIVSRWFIMESIRIRGNQYNLSLHRDVVSDYYNIIMTSPCYVEKGYVGNGDPLIYNNENVSFNQIKKAEYILKNNLGTPWLVAYLSRFHTEVDPETNQNIDKYNRYEGNFYEETDLAPDYILNSLNEYRYYPYSLGEASAYAYTDEISFTLDYQTEAQVAEGLSQFNRWGISKDSYVNSIAYTPNRIYPRWTSAVRKPIFASSDTRNEVFNELYTEYLTYGVVNSRTGLVENSYTHLGTFEDYLKIAQEANKIIKVGNKYYRIVAYNSLINNVHNSTAITNSAGTFGEKIFNSLINNSNLFYDWYIPNGAYKTPYITVPTQIKGVYLYFQELTEGTGTKIAYSFTYNANATKNAPYEIIASPLYDINFTHGEQSIAHNGHIALSWFMDLAQKQGNGQVYDVQILPYIGIDTTNISNYSIVTCSYDEAAGIPIAVAIKVPWMSFSETKALSIPIEQDYKISINCDLYRFCSPNGIGDFDFNPAKNGGLTGYEVDCTLIPYSPYIKINPIFQSGFLYGADFNDYRGLICKGDFSLPVVTNAWENYQVNNKYYQDIFDRETKSLELENKWNEIETWFGVGTGIIQGASSGAMAGAMSGNPATAAIGAAVGAGISAGGAVLDIIKYYQMTEDKMDARQKIFDLNLKTIQARPQTLTKSPVFNINNKYFPYIEYYTCTDKEKEIFKDKIKYNGMTVRAIGTIQNYLNPEPSAITYIKGQMIRLVGLDGDNHLASTIANEIKSGIYLGGQ